MTEGEFARPPRTRHPTRNYGLMAALLALLVGVHFILSANPGAARSVAQAAVFAWPGLAVTAVLGLIGVAALNRTPLPGLWDPETPLGRRLAWPLIVGLALGAAQAATDYATGFASVMARSLHLSSIHIAWPLSAPVYAGGAILVSIIYFLVLIPILVWLVSGVLLKGRGLEAVYWLTALPCALIEPLTQGDYSAAAGGDPTLVLVAIEDTALNLAQVWFLRRGGFIAAVLVRVAFYAVWHVAWPLIQG